ncbi:MAG TPA: hypothetical protein VMB49_16190 [Acidobacteriaceae bacterium]|nr:hypothetical protein [Acidobacteriaceae bacterium]
MTLMDAAVNDSTPNKKRRAFILAILGVAGVLIMASFFMWNIPAERRVNHFFAAIEKHDFPQAFGIWNNDPNWQQHAQQYAASGYSYGRFVSDWDTDGEYGAIKSHKILHATSRYGNSTLLAVEVNGRKSPLLTLAVEKHAHAMTFSPFALTPAETGLGWTYWQLSYR